MSFFANIFEISELFSFEGICNQPLSGRGEVLQRSSSRFVFHFLNVERKYISGVEMNIFHVILNFNG